MVTTLLRSASGISHPTRSKGPQVLLIAGRTPSALTTSGDFLEEKTVSSIRCLPRTTTSSACQGTKTFISMMRWWNTQSPGFVIRKRRHRTNLSFSISQRVQAMPRTRCRRNGATNTKASSIRADKLREETFARQKQLGVIPANAKLTPRDPVFPAWDSVPPDVKKVYARQMEVYAGF